MHVALFMDQHPHSLGGVQTSVLLQQKYLNRAGVKVTIFTPKHKSALPEPSIRVLPSNYMTVDGEYAVVWSLKKAAEFCEDSFTNDKFDIVHVQGDFASAALGKHLAKRFALPLVYTAHTNLDVMADKLFGKRMKRFLLKFFNWQHAHFLGLKNRPKAANAWQYMAFVHKDADAVLAPSGHFALELAKQGVAQNARVLLNGVDDDLIDGLVRQYPSPRRPVHFIWAGRMLPEKRLLMAIDAFARAKTDAVLDICGVGPLAQVAKRLVQARGLGARVSFKGKLSHRDMLQAFADSDALLQTSIGFETQGLTVFEAAAVGTPSILCDLNIATELPKGSFWTQDTDSTEGLARLIERAAAEIGAGQTKREALADSAWLRQSEITRRTIEIYQEQIAAKQATKN